MKITIEEIDGKSLLSIGFLLLPGFCVRFRSPTFWGLARLLLGIGCTPFYGAMAHENCSAEMSARAESLLIEARGNWRSLMAHQRAFAACDEGALGEGYSDAVVHLLAENRDQFHVFAELGEKFPAFRYWAIRHIDATASHKDLEKVIFNSKECTGNMAVKNLCGDIRQAAKQALAESK